MTENDKSISKWGNTMTIIIKYYLNKKGLLTGWRKIAESLPEPCDFTLSTSSDHNNNNNNQIAASHPAPKTSHKNRLKSIIANQRHFNLIVLINLKW